MVSILGTLFKYKEKESPDSLGFFPERVHIDAFPERRYLWTTRLLVIVTCLSICLNIVISCSIYLLLPQLRVRPRLFRIDKQENVLKEMQRSERYYYASDLIAEQYIRDYVILRYTVTGDYSELLDRWSNNSILYWYSSAEIFQDFQDKEVPMIEKQFKILGLQRYVEVDWVKHVSRSLWIAQFKTYSITKNNPRPKIDIWHASIRIAYDNRMRFKRPEDRVLNPYGFFVHGFTLSYLGDVSGKDAEVPGNLKYNMMLY